MIRRFAVPLTLFALSPLIVTPFSLWISTNSRGTMLFMVVSQLIYGVALTIALLSTPLLVGGLFFRRRRIASTSILLATILMIFCIGVGSATGRKLRMAAWRSFAERSQLLIDAIEMYEREHLVPPATLNDLVPEYVVSVPSTGLNAYPHFEYQTGADTKRLYINNPWILSVFTPSSIINFDMMLYFPNQNYPETGYGGRLERIGRWAYVHE
jgi:hypothetical protein